MDYQDQAYLECQGMMAEPEADGRMFIHGSMQCAYYVHGAVARALGCQVAVATHKVASLTVARIWSSLPSVTPL